MAVSHLLSNSNWVKLTVLARSSTVWLEILDRNECVILKIVLKQRTWQASSFLCSALFRSNACDLYVNLLRTHAELISKFRWFDVLAWVQIRHNLENVSGCPDPSPAAPGPLKKAFKQGWESLKRP